MSPNIRSPQLDSVGLRSEIRGKQTYFFPLLFIEQFFWHPFGRSPMFHGEIDTRIEASPKCLLDHSRMRVEERQKRYKLILPPIRSDVILVACRDVMNQKISVFQERIETLLN